MFLHVFSVYFTRCIGIHCLASVFVGHTDICILEQVGKFRLSANRIRGIRCDQLMILAQHVIHT